MADADVINYDELFRADPKAVWDLPAVKTVRLDDDSIDRLATALADKLNGPRGALRRYWARNRASG